MPVRRNGIFFQTGWFHTGVGANQSLNPTSGLAPRCPTRAKSDGGLDLFQIGGIVDPAMDNRGS